MSGAFVYGTAPYGYKKAAEKHKIIVDSPAAEQVHRIFAWAASGVTITQIAQRLNREEVTTPSVYLAAVRGKYKTRSFWTYESVRNILHNRIYTGDTVPFKSAVVRVGSNRVKMIAEENCIILPDTHEAIVSRALYEQAQKVVKTKRKSNAKAANNPLTSFLYCGCCGNRLVKGKAQNRNWRCASARYKPDSDCDRVHIEEERLRAVLLRAIKNQCILFDAKLQKARIVEKGAAMEYVALQSELKRKKMRLERLQEQRVQSYESYALGKINKETFIEEKNAVAIEEQNCRAEMKKLEECLIIGTKNELRRKTCMNDQRRFLKTAVISELTRPLMKELVKRITIYPGEEINIEWNFRDEMNCVEMAT